MVPSRSGNPQQNGHERMHLTLKLETTKLAGRNFLQQQAQVRRRSHSALGNIKPTEYAPIVAFPGRNRGRMLRYAEGSAPRPVVLASLFGLSGTMQFPFPGPQRCASASVPELQKSYIHRDF